MSEAVKPGTGPSARPTDDEGDGLHQSEELAAPSVPTQAQIKHLFRNHQDNLPNQRIHALVSRFRDGSVA